MSKPPVHTITTDKIFVGLDRNAPIVVPNCSSNTIKIQDSAPLLDQSYVIELIKTYGPNIFLQEMLREDILKWLKENF